MGSNIPASCSDATAMQSAQDALEHAPAGKVLGLKIIDMQEAREISRTNVELKCTARVKLNNSHRADFRYRFYTENNRLFIEAKLSD